MTYIRVRWLHNHPETPVLLYSELDEQRFELRKVEVYGDGRCGYADQLEEVGGSGLGTVPVPGLSEIASDPEFEPAEIEQAEFERIWTERQRLRRA